MATIRVIRQFTFSHPLGRAEKVARERVFPVGEHEIGEDIANHPWIARHFADGCIETPEQAQERAAAATVVALKAQDDANYWKAHAEAAMKRAESLSLVQTNGDRAAMERELNTPVNQLGGHQGAGIVSATPGEAAAGAGADDSAPPSGGVDSSAPSDPPAATAAETGGKKKGK